MKLSKNFLESKLWQALQKLGVTEENITELPSRTQYLIASYDKELNNKSVTSWNFKKGEEPTRKETSIEKLKHLAETIIEQVTILAHKEEEPDPDPIPEPEPTPGPPKKKGFWEGFWEW